MDTFLLVSRSTVPARARLLHGVVAAWLGLGSFAVLAPAHAADAAASAATPASAPVANVALPAAASAPAVVDDSLFKAFGGMENIQAISADLLANAEADPRIKAYFEGIGEKRFKQKLAEQICNLTGGPCVYTGRTMKETHKGEGVDRAAYYALIEDLQKAMDKNHVPFHAQNKLLAKMAPMYHDIEER